MQNIYFNSFDTRYKTPFGAVKTGQEVLFKLSVSKMGKVHSPCFCIYEADEIHDEQQIKMELTHSDNLYNWYTASFVSDKANLYFYYFTVIENDTVREITRGTETPHWQLTVYDKDMRKPAVLNGIMYQIFPDRFCKSGELKENIPQDRFIHNEWLDFPHYLPDEQGEITNNDYYGGDLAGIKQKLPYLKSLGVGIIYLNPIFEAHSNHRYNTADYSKIDSMLGTEEDFAQLCTEAKKQNMSVILDGVFSHTGDDSVYFNKQKRYGEGGAYNDKDSIYRTWYKFKAKSKDYVSWWGFETLPEVDENNLTYRDFICGEHGILKKWLELGASGYRLDVADELPDKFLNLIRSTIKNYDKDCALIGEVWEDASNKISYGVRRKYLLGQELDSVMNYPFKDCILSYVRYGSYSYFMKTVMEILENYPRPVINALMNSLSTHDTERAITKLAGEEINGDRQWQAEKHYLNDGEYSHGKKLLKLASIVQYTISGIPCLYYGDEVGLSGYKDPFNRTCYPYGHEDEELLEHFKLLGKFRTKHKVLVQGDFNLIECNENVLSFVRYDEKEKVFVAINRSYLPQKPQIPKEFLGAKTLYGEYDGELKEYSGVILAKTIK